MAATDSCHIGRTPTLCIILVAMLFLVITPCVFSSSIVPYDPGDTQEVASAAAGIVNVECVRTFDESIFTFDVHVFADCWEPVYSIRFEALDLVPLTAVAWPKGWRRMSDSPLLGDTPGNLGFTTDSNPISPGAKLSGFALSTSATATTVRWYPADSQGALIGKASRLMLACPTSVEPGTWGSLKALFK